MEPSYDVLVVGGSTLLPGVFPRLERRFDRRRLRAWQPFEAVAFGAASFAAVTTSVRTTRPAMPAPATRRCPTR